MMAEKTEDIAVALFAELFITDQLARNRISKVLPKGMELSQFSVLNHLARLGEERTPAQLARAFHVTRGAMTNTLTKLEWAGHVHIRPDWDDARQKFVAISPAGRAAHHAGRTGDVALSARAKAISHSHGGAGSVRCFRRRRHGHREFHAGDCGGRIAD